MKMLNLLDEKEVKEEIEFEEYLHEDGSWQNSRGGDYPSAWESCVEIPRSGGNNYRYFLCQDNKEFISIRRMEK